jgi:hypothetical protein
MSISRSGRFIEGVVVIKKSCFFIGVFLCLNVFSFDSINKNIKSIQFIISVLCAGVAGYKVFNLCDLIDSRIKNEVFVYKDICPTFIRNNITKTSIGDDEKELYKKDKEGISSEARMKSYLNCILSIVAFTTTFYATNFGKNMPYKRIGLLLVAPVWLIYGFDAPVKRCSWHSPFDQVARLG